MWLYLVDIARRSVASLAVRAVLSAASLVLYQIPVQAEGTLRVPYVSDIGSFDPDNGFEVGGLSAINNVYEGLVEYEPGSTNIVGLLARSWEISKDGLTYTFHLRDGVKFHDGTPMNAEAVKTSLERRRDGNMLLSYSLGNLRSVEVVDPLTVELRLGHPQPSLLDGLSSPWGPKVLSPKAIKDHDEGEAATTWLTENAVGTGPFKLAQFQRGERYVLERNNDYWGKIPFFEKVEISVVPEISQQILQLQAGSIDAVPINYPFAQLENLPAGLDKTAAPSMTLFALFPRPGSPTDDAEIRNAVLAAINPALWISDAFGRFASPAMSPFPKAMLQPDKPIAFPDNLASAKAAIAAKQQPIEIRIGLHSAAPSYARISDLLIAQLASIGVSATAYVLPAGAAYSLKDDPNPPDMLLTIAGPDAAHPENHATVFFTADAPLNYFDRALPEADKIVAEAGLQTDTQTRNGLYEKAGQLYFDAGYVIPLTDVDDVVVHRKGLKGLGLRPVYSPGNIDFSTAYWEKSR